MKTIITAIMLCSSISAYCQKNPCERLTTTKDDLRGWKSLHSPYNEIIIVQRTTWENGLDSSFIQVMIKSIVSNSNNKGVFIQFDDGSFYREPNTILQEHFIGGNYIVLGNIYITEDNYIQFVNKKIVKVGLGGFTKSITPKLSNNIPYYLQCIKN